MSLTHSICFTILVICNYVSLENSISDTSDAEGEVQDVQSIHPGQENQPALFTWPQGLVPYYINPESYDKIIANRIRMAMNMIESVSCVVFTQIPDKPEGQYLGYTWLYIVNPNNARECTHDTLLGDGGTAIMTLGYDCMQRRDIIHALLHVLGFRDEVTHPQRDLYIRIMWQNIQPKYRPLFRMRTDEAPHKMLVEYDTMSVMHFHDRAYSVNGGATVAPLIPGLIINPSEKLSQLDIMKLRMAFGHECNKRKVGNLLETCQNALHSGQSGTEDEERSESKGSSDESVGTPLQRTKNGTQKRE